MHNFAVAIAALSAEKKMENLTAANNFAAGDPVSAENSEPADT